MLIYSIPIFLLLDFFFGEACRERGENFEKVEDSEKKLWSFPLFFFFSIQSFLHSAVIVGFELMSHIINLWERARFSQVIKISKHQFGFMAKRSVNYGGHLITWVINGKI